MTGFVKYGGNYIIAVNYFAFYPFPARQKGLN